MLGLIDILAKTKENYLIAALGVPLTNIAFNPRHSAETVVSAHNEITRRNEIAAASSKL